MGLLSLGTPLPWEESRQYSEHIRKNGLAQLINMFNAAYNRSDDKYLWGDEVEYILVQFNEKLKTAKINIDKDYILEDLNKSGEMFELAKLNNANFHPEYGRFMIEATPLKPYDGDSIDDYLYVEKNMNMRRVVAERALNDSNIKPLTITSYPLMGVGNFTEPKSEPNGNASRSLFLPDEIINRHVRFPTLTANIRKRRGEKVAINIPMFQDKFTSKNDESIPLNRGLFPEDEEPSLGAAKPGHIYLDSMGFGMGCSCLQVTVQAPNINKARYLYDSWANLAPIFLSLTAAAPIFKGYLADQDVRWNVISGAVDDRTPIERGVEPLRKGHEYGNIREDHKDHVQRIPKSRYDSIDSYLGDLQTSNEQNQEPSYRFFKESLNDISPPINDLVLKLLLNDPNKHFDKPLASHFAHLYIRDPLVIFNERINQNNEQDTDHFENIQSTNWQTLRFKPPTQAATPDNKSIPGWRVEFRSMEIQITDFENAAFSTFIALIGQAFIHHPDVLNFYIPISKIEENMKLAHKRDSVLNDKFFFKKNVLDDGYEFGEFTMDEIINGGENFIGLIAIVKTHLKNNFNIDLTKDDPEHSRLYYYLLLISKRASGEIPTTANFIRSFVTKHKEYKQDSKINDIINYELLEKINRISNYQNENNELVEFFGEELSTYLIGNKLVREQY